MAVRTQKHEILDLRVAAFLCSVDDVVKFSLTFSRHFQAYRKRLSRSGTSIGFYFWQITKWVAALVHTLHSLRTRAFGDALLYVFVVAFLFRCEVAISLALFEEAIRSGSVLRRICRLENEIFIVVEPKPLESFDDRAGRLVRR